MGLCASSGPTEGDEGGKNAKATSVQRQAGTWIFDEKEELKTDLQKYYTQGKQLGQPGQFGVAYICTLNSDEKKVEKAVKVIDKSRFIQRCGKKERQQYYKQFREEIQIMKDMEHENVIKLFDILEDETNLYLVMEKCSGGELFDRIKSKGRYSEKDAAGTLLKFAQGIHYLHSKRIAHCDLKPDNILFVNTDEDSPLKIIDFGMSKYSPHKQNITGFRGTPYYVAPEVIRGDYTIHCDMWSFGIISFVMVLGFPPFHSRNQDDHEIFQKIKQGFQPETKAGYGNWFPEKVKVSDSFKDLITHCLETDPTKRYSSQEVLDHPWVTGKDASDEPLMDIVLKNLSEFTSNCKFKSLILEMMTDCLSDNEINQMKQTFEKMDKDKDGTISKKELQEAFETEFKGDGSDEDEAKKKQIENLEKLMKSADADGDGTLSYKELLMTSVQRKIRLKEERIEAAFDKFDLDGDGKLTTEEIENVLGKNSDEAKEILAEVDSDGDGKIDREEFIKMWRGKEAKKFE